MSKLIEQIKTDKITAMKAGHKLRKDTLTLIQAAIKQVEVDTRKELLDADVVKILTKMVKQRNDSISQYTSAGRTELASIEESEKAIISQYIPAQMSEDEIRAKVAEVVAPGDNIGQAMGKVKSVFAGKADMSLVSRIVKETIGA